ncbi:type II toxin-antitoxin system RelE/ParE family toxin [uncultured Ruminococcus sp.]|uniref:type II toxin-antitoxin system RelE family toxin n=1 Tax=uncultured Ruminococcus sp. TaxID=165186 RepID=UPI0025F707BC|nr:type II toxin-antitoxin system RelE/ParE family toxin [uncultured Ruminococcus sp.]
MEIIYTKRAAKHIAKLDKPTKNRIKAGIEGIPGGDIKRLQGITPPEFRLRVGEYRIIFEMTTEEIVIRDVLPRGKAYERL